MSDRLIALLLLLVCAGFYWQSISIRRPPFAAFDPLGADTFPRAVALVLAIFSLVLLVRGGGSVVPRLTGARARVWLLEYRLPLISLVLFAAYVATIPQVGWLIATAVFLVVMQLLLHPRWGRGLLGVVLGSAIFSWLIAEFFQRYLHVVLPRGTLF